MSRPPLTLTEFRKRAEQALADPHLQQALRGATRHFREGRERAWAEFPHVEELRDHLKAIRSATLARLAEHLETFERNARAAGAHVHWARDGEEANRIIVDIARQHGVKLLVKSKSMTGEEIQVNAALDAAGILPVETDLGEWIIQLAGEPPAHIIAPAIHKTRYQVAELLRRTTGQDLSAEDIPTLTAAARSFLRDKFLQADMGLSGVNVAVAETGSIVLVTNEGNGRMVTSVPPVHVAVMGVEKIVPTWHEAAAWLQLLARSATGQPLSVYTTVITGPARPEDPDGPQELHIIILDNGRTRALGSPFEEVLQCIRCGSCLNVCPVYREVGGQTYGSPYSGPIGIVVTPLLFGLDAYPALPHACTLCGACTEVCPARIDLPRMILEWRHEEAVRGMLPRVDHWGERGTAWLLRHPRLWRSLVRLLRFLQKPFQRNSHVRLPRPLRWVGERDLPPLAERSFHEIWASGELDEQEQSHGRA